MQAAKISLSTSSTIKVSQFKDALFVNNRTLPSKEQNHIDFRALLVLNRPENVKCFLRVALEERQWGHED